MPVKRPVPPPDGSTFSGEVGSKVDKKYCCRQGDFVLQWSISRMLLITTTMSVVFSIAFRDSPFRNGFLYVWSHVGEIFGFCQGLEINKGGFGFALGQFGGVCALCLAVSGCVVLFCLAWIWTEKE